MKKIALVLTALFAVMLLMTGCFNTAQPAPTVMPTVMPTEMPVPTATDPVSATGAPGATDAAGAVDATADPNATIDPEVTDGLKVRNEAPLQPCGQNVIMASCE